MPTLKNVRHEKFCLEVAAGCSHSEAARKAGYSVCNRVVPYRLMQFPEVRQRIAEIREAAASDAVMKLTERKEKLSNIARREEINKPQLAINAIVEMNKMEGSYAPAKLETENRSIAIKRIIVHEPYIPGKVIPDEEPPALPEHPKS